MNLVASNSAKYLFFSQCFVYLILVFLFLNMNALYLSFDSEFGLFELSGTLALFVTSLLLFKAARDYKKTNQAINFKFCMLALMGLVFFWAAGEEISWGQHFFGTETPDWLAAINGQNETNLHNINKKFFDRYLERFTVLLVLISTFLHAKGREHLLGFRVPEYPLTLAFILMPIYRQFQELGNNDIWPVGFLALLVYLYLGIKNKNKELILMFSLVVVTALSVVYFHHNNWILFNGKTNIYNEVKEMAFSFICAFYAYQLYRDVAKTT